MTNLIKFSGQTKLDQMTFGIFVSNKLPAMPPNGEIVSNGAEKKKKKKKMEE